MARLIYASNMSLDGCTEDERGAFDWAPPDDDVFAFITELMRSAGTYLYGRRMYEAMLAWETMSDPAPVMRDYTEIWRAADKIVYSKTLASAASARTHIERDFDPEAIRQLKTAANLDLSVGGPTLAAAAIAAGLVDELHLFLNPIVVGGGKPALPNGVRLPLELMDERRFDSGVVYVRYGTRGAP